MEEQCISVDAHDQARGPISKKAAHLMENIRAGTALHRAFSVFLFDGAGRLLLQQRADEKITFPAYWTNTCCSHPLWLVGADADGVVAGRHEELDPKREREERGQLGVRLAAKRKLAHELGLDVDKVVPDVCADFTFLTRILYEAPCDGGVWGEHEGITLCTRSVFVRSLSMSFAIIPRCQVDYILFLQRDGVDLSNLNSNEVQAVRYVTREELRGMIAQAKGGCMSIGVNASPMMQ